MSKDSSDALRSFFQSEVDDVLRETFYRPDVAHESLPLETKPAVAKKKRIQKPKPDHYEVICISMYKEDLEALDSKVSELKSGGHRKMTRSALIRYALANVETSKIPRGI